MMMMNDDDDDDDDDGGGGNNNMLYYCCNQIAIQRICIRIGALATLGARHFCPKNMHEKLTKCPNFT